MRFEVAEVILTQLTLSRDLAMIQLNIGWPPLKVGSKHFTAMLSRELFNITGDGGGDGRSGT